MTTAGSPPVRPARWGLKGKLIVSMLLVGVVPLLTGLLLAFFQGSREIREVSGESFKALAIEAARKLDLLVGEEVARTSRIAVDPLIVLEMERQRDERQDLSEEERLRRTAQKREKWEAQDPATVKAITDSPIARLLRDYYSGSSTELDQMLPHVVRAATQMLYITDLDGQLVAAVTVKPPFDNGTFAWWKGAYNNGAGLLFIQDLYFDERSDTYVFSISIPIMDSLRYETVGVLHRVIDAKAFFSPSTHPIRFGKTGHVMLIDSRGIVMSCPILPTGVRIADLDLIPLVTPHEPGWVQASSDGHGGTSKSIIGFSPLPETSRATNGTTDEGAWHTFVWQSSEELFAPIQHLLTWMSVFGSLAVVLLAALGSFAAGRIVTPVRKLQLAARAIGHGELREPIAVKTGDELEELAEEINRMNSQLERAFAGLTSQVELKSQEVRILEQSTDRILDAVPSPIFMVDHEAAVHYMNRASREAFDLQEANPEAGTLYDLLHLPTGARDRLQRELAILGNGHGRERLTSATRTALARDPLAPGGGEEEADRRELQVGNAVYRYEWFSLPARPGEADRLGLVLRNATDESRLQEQLIEAEKKGSLGVLTAGIGHELNNPLFGILGLGEAIQHEPNSEQVKQYAKDIVQHGKRMAGIIRDFAGVTRADTGDRRGLVDLTRLLESALRLVQQSMGEWEIEVEKRYGSLPPINAVGEELLQAFVNVILNAAQAMKGTGRLTIIAEQGPVLIQVTIQDSGPGISKPHLLKIFDPFFTTKQQGQGSGLGLTIARRLLMKNGGHIRMESTPGQGASCMITFPIPQDTAQTEGTG